MKKLILAVFAAIILAPAFTSCDKGEYKCYEVTFTNTEGTTVTIHKWMRETDKNTYVSEHESLGYTDITVTAVTDIPGEEYRNKTMADCTPPGEL